MPVPEPHLYVFGDWCLDPAERQLLHNGTPVPLTPKVFETLLLLVENAGRLVAKEEFMKRVWPDAFVEDLALAQNISQIRKSLSGNGAMIETVPKRGYRFTAAVQVLAAPESKRGNASAAASAGSSSNHRSQNPMGADAHRLPFNSPAGGMACPVVFSTESGSQVARRRIWLVAIVALACASAIALVWIRLQHAVSAEISSPPIMIPLLDVSGEERMPALSPDGSRIAFLRHAGEPGKSGIYVEVVGSQSLLQISNNGSDFNPAWSPDGREVAFIRNSGDKFSIEIIPSLGGAERQVFTGEQVPIEGPVSVSFSADGQQLAFADWDAAGQQSAIKLITLADSSIRRLTLPPSNYHDVAPSFSPDGKQVAFIRSTGPMFVDDIFVVPVTGGVPRQVTFDRRRMFSAPAWAKDGDEIFFSSTHAGMKSLWRIPANGGIPRPIAGSGAQTDNPTVSRAQGEIAYEHTIEEENLWRLDLRGGSGSTGIPTRTDSTAPTGLLSSKTSNLMPQFSPDGHKIAFESDRSGYEEIWICDADGSNPTQMTRLERYSGSPRWSPDGRSIAFDFRSQRHSEIYVVDVASGSTRAVASFADADNVVPSWSRDGNWIYFASNRGSKDFHVWKAPLVGGNVVQVIRGPSFAAFESADGQDLFYTRLSEAGIWKVTHEGGHALLWKGPGPNNWANWAVIGTGIYFIVDAAGMSEVRFLSFSSGKTEAVTRLQKPAFYGLTAAADGKAVVYSQRDRNQHDIVLMKNFH
jgi:Tol biopolymer transport system component/DNA-binding winged helix-turn-helix (wHTH) protein